ncbi:MAG: T9SS type A sorting domain-containing protein [Chitinophagales bacterium]
MKWILPLLVLIGATAFAQKNNDVVVSVDYKQHCSLSFPKQKLASENTPSGVIVFLKNYLPPLKNDKCGLHFNYVNNSPGGLHYSFTQTYNGIEVYQAEIKVNIDRNNIIRSVLDNSFDVSDWQISSNIPSTSTVIAVDKETGEAFLAEKRIENFSKEALYVKGEKFYERSLNSYADSMVTGNVFLPDPLTTAHQQYNNIDLDSNDKSTVFTTTQLRTVSFKAGFNAGVFELRNPFVRIIDLDSPQVVPATSTTPSFLFNRSQSGFEDVNVFYHLNKVRDHADSLGFDLANHEIWADPHGGDNDNSYFAPAFSPPRIFYGIGGIDDAEDADVVTHEYGHFLSYNASPNSNIGIERTSLDEGFGDYIAAAYSKIYDSYKGEWIFNWDGHNQYWNGRVVNSSKVYPTNINSNMYNNAEIWSAVLMEIHDAIGKPATDSLIYEAHYNYATNMKMDDAAYLLLDADSNLTGGVYHCLVYEKLMNRGLVPFFANNPCGFSSINEPEENPVRFMQNGSSFTIINAVEQGFSFAVMSVNGSLVDQGKSNESILRYENKNLPTGIYIIRVVTPKATKGFKWIKAE